MECSKCDNTQLAGTFCFKCGSRLQTGNSEVQPIGNTYCPHCGQQIPSDPTHTFCIHCGKVLRKTAFQEFEQYWWAVNLILLAVVFLTFSSPVSCVVSGIGILWFFGVPIALHNLEKDFQMKRGKTK